MTNTTKNEVTGLAIPMELLKKIGLGDAIEMDVFQDLIAVKNHEMTALEMINTIEGLECIILELYGELVATFPSEDECENCDLCGDFTVDCVDVPDWAKEVAGIDIDTKMCICVEEDSERIILEPVSYAFDITNVSAEMLDRLMRMGVCLGELNESIMQEEIIYGV